MSQPLVRLPSLDLIKGFVAVGRRMSITQAADDLCLTQSAISKQIRALEDILGVALFNRGFRSVTFTEQGQLLFQVADESIQQLQNVVGLVSSPRRKPVTVTTSTSVASLWILPRLGEFLSVHPHIDVRFSATNSVLELGEDVDLAIRYCSEKQAPRGATRLFGETIAPVAASSLGIHSFESIGSLEAATLLEFDVQGRPWLHWSDWLAARGWSTARAKAVLHFNQYEQMIQAAIDGRGLALGRLELLQPYLQDGQLRVLDAPPRARTESPHAFWLVRAESSPRIEVERLAEWILASAKEVAAPAHGGL
jgi:LysR family transcriptional regulator, glycine cleavage system transcriptional activator